MATVKWRRSTVSQARANRECGAERKFQDRSCPRNCKRRARATLPLGQPGKAVTGGDPRARRPAVDSVVVRAGCLGAGRTASAPASGRSPLRSDTGDLCPAAKRDRSRSIHRRCDRLRVHNLPTSRRIGGRTAPRCNLGRIDGEILKGCGDEACPQENIVELANGCLCCTVADDFVPALDTILARKPVVEHIVIETSGLALPKPLVQAFHWPAIKSRVTVDGVVAVVDGAALAEGRLAADPDALARQREADTALDHDDPIEEVFDDQIACADLVVLNKRDLLDPPGTEKAIAAIVRALPRAVKIVPVANGKVDPAALLGLGIGTEDDIANRRTRHDAELEHDHDDFESFVLPLPEISDPARLSARIAAAGAAARALRVDALAAVAGKPMRLLVQAVGPRVTHHYDRAWTAAEKRQGRLVVIGMKGLNRDGIKRALSG